MRILFLALGAMLAFGFANANAAASAKKAPTAQAVSNSQLAPLRAVLQTPDSEIDLAKAKLTIDRMIDPKIDVAATLRQLDTLAARIRARFPVGASDAVKMELLLASLREPGPWSSVTGDIQSQSQSRNQLITLIPTTGAQDAAAAYYLALNHPGMNDVGKLDNCAVRVNEGLMAGGLPSLETPFPGGLSRAAGTLPGAQTFFIPQGGPIPAALLNILPSFNRP